MITMSEEINKVEHELSRSMALADKMTEELTALKVRITFLRSQLSRLVSQQNNPLSHVINNGVQG